MTISKTLYFIQDVLLRANKLHLHGRGVTVHSNNYLERNFGILIFLT